MSPNSPLPAPQALPSADMKYMNRETLIQEKGIESEPVKLTWSCWTQPYYTTSEKDAYSQDLQSWPNSQTLHTAIHNEHGHDIAFEAWQQSFTLQSEALPPPYDYQRHITTPAPPTSSFVQNLTPSGHPDWGVAPTPASSVYVRSKQRASLNGYPQSYHRQHLTQNHTQAAPASHQNFWNTIASQPQETSSSSSSPAQSVLRDVIPETNAVSMEGINDDVWCMLQEAAQSQMTHTDPSSSSQFQYLSHFAPAFYS